MRKRLSRISIQNLKQFKRINLRVLFCLPQFLLTLALSFFLLETFLLGFALSFDLKQWISIRQKAKEMDRLFSVRAPVYDALSPRDRPVADVLVQPASLPAPNVCVPENDGVHNFLSLGKQSSVPSHVRVPASRRE